MSIGEDLRTFLLADAGIAAIVGTNVFQNKIPQGTENLPAIWFRRSSSENERTLEANVGQTTQYRESFDIEAVSEDIDESEDLGTLVKSLDTSIGTFGVAKIQAMFVDDQNDGYRVKNIGDDDGRHVSALDVEIVGYKEP